MQNSCRRPFQNGHSASSWLLRVFAGLLLAGAIADAGLPAQPAVPDTEQPVLRAKEAESIARTLAQKRSYLRFCVPEDKKAVLLPAERVATRTWPGRVEVFVNGAAANPRCMYVEEGSRYVHILDRIHRRPPSQPAVLSGEAIPAEAKAWNPEETARGIFEETNLARTRPADYAKFLEAMLSCFDGKTFRPPNRAAIATREGRAAVEEAIRFLKGRLPLPPLEFSNELSLASLDHVRDQGPRGAVGHRGSDGSDPTARIRRHGVGYSTAAENIAYGQKRARDVVIALIVDDGVSDRGHRKNLFSDHIDEMGVACGPHRVYEWMCVQDMVGSLR